MDMIGRIRHLHPRKNKSEREISRMTGLSRNTVAKWLHGEVDGPPKYRRGEQPNKLTAFHDVLRQALKADARRPKHERRTAKALYAEIRRAGYEGGYTRVTDFIRAWRQGEGQGSAGNAFVPLAFELGEAFQFDWSEEGMVIGGIYDNMKTAVDKVKKGKGRIVNERFATMCAHYLYDPDFCNVASGWEKGVVEKNVQDSRRRIWIDAAKIKFGSFTELNAWLAQRCRALWDEVSHPEHTQFSVAEMLEHERAHLMPMPVPFDGYVEKPARVTSTCLVSVARNRYSVPCERVGQMVSTRLYPGSVAIVADDTIVARHDRLSNAGETRYDWQHYIPLLQRKPGALRNGAPFADMPEPLQRLRRGLLRNPGGDRVMAQVLAIVLSAGLDAVLVAIELALESGPPGKVSVEHVVNVLNRLNAQPVPPTAATLLRATTPPLANTARYDSLRSDTVGAITEGADHED